ncbi:prolyl-tRNA synthetase associated domain-containing protein [Luteithermobacter gelatinilyticus]|uniref:prolyl-tRNA synthetase associated domain-containing protein n=1 Tax=Luteithermobacter gelatinilyticus TaxID=2582913 RepID=UPI001AF0012C|nr:prolyl-tRNA synthetase associated domain-containing protein [Luteithermobacter gelatinilyticus]|tara:strand:+ start:15123 stop:15686 length:564 start_codon:yes stop_codon:yes gene_type:complete
MATLDPKVMLTTSGEVEQREQKLFGLLERLGIETVTHRHPPLHTVEESRRLRGDIEGGHCKSLFLKDKKGQLLLVVLMEDRRLDMKKLTAYGLLPTGRLSFAPPELMEEILGVTPGSVTPFSLINVPSEILQQGRLTVVLDQAMMAHEKLNYHPLHNQATTTIRTADLDKFIRHFGLSPVIIDFDNL